IAPPSPPPLFPYTTLFRSHSPKWKMLLHGMQIGLPKAASCLFQLIGIRDLYNAASDPDVKSLLRPEASPFCRHQKRHLLIRRWRSEEHTSELQSRFDLVCR